MTDREFLEKIARNAHRTGKRVYLNEHPYLVVWSLNGGLRGGKAKYVDPNHKLTAKWRRRLEQKKSKSTHAPVERKPSVRGLPSVLPLLPTGVRP